MYLVLLWFLNICNTPSQEMVIEYALLFLNFFIWMLKSDSICGLIPRLMFLNHLNKSKLILHYFSYEWMWFEHARRALNLYTIGLEVF